MNTAVDVIQYLSGLKPINARAETMFDKPMFRNARMMPRERTDPAQA